MNAIIGCMLQAKSSIWLVGGDTGSGSLVLARVAMNTAPTPIGPKWPEKRASRNVLMSGIHRYSAITAGKRRRMRTRMPMRTRRHGLIVSSGALKSSNGIQAPM